MYAIRYRGRLVAGVDAEQAVLMPEIAALERDHPRRVFVAFMCAYAFDVTAGTLPGPYTDEDAELFARCALMPDSDFDRVQAESEATLAEAFNVPLEQVMLKRDDLLRHPPRRWLTVR
jgi:hypothetical protein